MTGFEPLALPGDAHAIGFVPPVVATPLLAAGLLLRGDDGLRLDGDGQVSERLRDACAVLSATGVIGPARGELMPVRATPVGPVLAEIDRSALRAFGFWAHKVHLNGLCAEGSDGPSVWLSRRARDARSFPGAFDTLVAGGVPSHLGCEETLAAESVEEAGIDGALLACAQAVGQWTITYRCGPFLHREILIVRDLWLPSDFRPVCSDGEIEASSLLPWPRFCAAVSSAVDFKPNSLAVCQDLVARLARGADPGRR